MENRMATAEPNAIYWAALSKSSVCQNRDRTRMEICILRHGNAAEAHGGMKDADRALTPEGAKKLQSVLRRAKSVDVKPSIIVTSPYRRARETAQVAAQVLPGGPTLVESRSLTPDS